MGSITDRYLYCVPATLYSKTRNMSLARTVSDNSITRPDGVKQNLFLHVKKSNTHTPKTTSFSPENQIVHHLSQLTVMYSIAETYYFSLTQTDLTVMVNLLHVFAVCVTASTWAFHSKTSLLPLPSRHTHTSSRSRSGELQVNCQATFCHVR